MAKLYLISPPKIELASFLVELEEALKTQKVSVFQLRLKDIKEKELIKNSQAIMRLCNEYNIPFILNDDFDLALRLGAEGVHLGSDDGSIKHAKDNSPEGFIIGASCYDSKDAVMKAAEDGASYVALGAFFQSNTKQSKGKPTLELLKWCDYFINTPIVCIGGINSDNYKPLIDNGADFIAVISYIWDHKIGVKTAIDSLIQ
jgi:thiamine-phosphate pyrophosphorylase